MRDPITHSRKQHENALPFNQTQNRVGGQNPELVCDAFLKLKIKNKKDLIQLKRGTYKSEKHWTDSNSQTQVSQQNLRVLAACGNLIISLRLWGKNRQLTIDKFVLSRAIQSERYGRHAGTALAQQIVFSIRFLKCSRKDNIYRKHISVTCHRHVSSARWSDSTHCGSWWKHNFNYLWLNYYKISYSQVRKAPGGSQQQLTTWLHRETLFVYSRCTKARICLTLITLHGVLKQWRQLL